VTETPDDHSTWEWSTRGGKLSLRIDYLFHSPELTTRSSEIIPETGSDHRLVVSEFAPTKPPLVHGE
jgi:endonuclease/exonuclease/phosphatase (EEP) superfamily protein YafD